MTIEIDDCLGPGSGRFFGEGFKRVDQRVLDIDIDHAEDRGRLRATASVAYPGDWSQKAAGSPRAHLSSVDALVLAVQLAEAYLTHAYELTPAQRRRVWLRRVDMNAGSRPQEDLDAFPVQAVHRAAAEQPVARANQVSRFACTIGTLRVGCELEHARGDGRPADGSYASIEDVLGATRSRFYGRGYKARAQRIGAIGVAPDQRTIGATVHVVATGASVAAEGAEGAYQPGLSMVDCFLALAQLAQVLAYRRDGIERRDSETLWMRRLSLVSTRPPAPIDRPFAARVDAAGDRLVKFAAGHWRTFDLTGDFHGVLARASIAHRLPNRTPRSQEG